MNVAMDNVRQNYGIRMDENDLPEALLNRGIVTAYYLLHVLLSESEEAEPPAKRSYLEELLSKEDMLIQERRTPIHLTRTGVISDDTKVE